LESVQVQIAHKPFPRSDRTEHRITQAGLKHGIIIRPIGDVVIVMPAPAMPEADLNRLLDATQQSIEEGLRGWL